MINCVIERRLSNEKPLRDKVVLGATQKVVVRNEHGSM